MSLVEPQSSKFWETQREQHLGYAIVRVEMAREAEEKRLRYLIREELVR